MSSATLNRRRAPRRTPDRPGATPSNDGDPSAGVTLQEAIERVIAALGTLPVQADHLSVADVQLLRMVASVLEAGLPLVAMLQLVRVYGQAMARVADAEVRLFHLYVHEPLMRSGAPGVETADEMFELTRQLLPLAAPVMDQIHHRYLQHFVEQDVVGDDARVIKTIGDEAMIVRIAEVRMKGFTESTEVFVARGTGSRPPLHPPR